MFIAISLVGKLFLIGGRDFEDFYVINPFNSETFPPARDPAINTLELYFIFWISRVFFYTPMRYKWSFKFV